MIQKNITIKGPQIDQFNSIGTQPTPRSTFIRSFPKRTTFNADDLVPIFVDEILPGDDFRIKMTALCRMATPFKPLMENLFLETFWFFVPNRLVWSNWEKFQGEKNVGDSTLYTIPVLDHTTAPLSTTGFAIESMMDQMGIRPLTPGIQNISALFSRAYRLIYQDWFRDENLQLETPVDIGDGPDDSGLTTIIQKRNKRKDYFTSMLPWPQKGDPVSIALGGLAPVISTAIPPTFRTAADATERTLGFSSSGTTYYPGSLDVNPRNSGLASFTNAYFEKTGLTADLSNSSPITINALRQAALYQQILELDARGGTRYIESLYSRFGVISPDFRLQRPELIGQGQTRINMYAVPQTSEGTDTPQGNLAAFSATVADRSHEARYSATEHGIVIGLANVRADLTYQQGLPRMFSRRTRLDFYEPLLNGLGEQAILNQELYVSNNNTQNNTTAGYQERFAEYRFKNAEICGKFRSDAPQSLDIWHLSQDFGALPTLNYQFIQSETPMDRVLAVTDESDFLFDAHFDFIHTRPMPVRSNPGITRL